MAEKPDSRKLALDFVRALDAEHRREVAAAHPSEPEEITNERRLEIAREKRRQQIEREISVFGRPSRSCRDCQFFLLSDRGFMGWCQSPVVKMITNRNLIQEDKGVRSTTGACGPDGLFWDRSPHKFPPPDPLFGPSWEPTRADKLHALFGGEKNFKRYFFSLVSLIFAAYSVWFIL